MLATVWPHGLGNLAGCMLGPAVTLHLTFCRPHLPAYTGLPAPPAYRLPAPPARLPHCLSRLPPLPAACGWTLLAGRLSCGAPWSMIPLAGPARPGRRRSRWRRGRPSPSQLTHRWTPPPPSSLSTSQVRAGARNAQFCSCCPCAGSVRETIPAASGQLTDDHTLPVFLLATAPPCPAPPCPAHPAPLTLPCPALLTLLQASPTL